MSLKWSNLDKRTVDWIRILAVDSVEEAGSGHPGTAISLAPLTHLLFHHLLKHDPSKTNWMARDRFVLSCGHTSLSLYVNLYLSGYNLSLRDLKNYRKLGSKTPGHPEREIDGVEVTTGPLGQGIGNIVGMALSQRYINSLFDDSDGLFDHYIYGICSDGDIEEGVASEASSLAGHLKLGKIILIYDDNHISIEGNTEKAFSEDVLLRYEAYSWHTQRVNFLKEDGSYEEDVSALYDAIEKAKACENKPSIIALRTIIGHPSPTLANTGKIHGAAMGAEETASLKRLLDFDDKVNFPVFDELLKYRRGRLEKQKTEYKSWLQRFEKYYNGLTHQRRVLLEFLSNEQDHGKLYRDELQSETDRHLKSLTKDMATRAASGEFINIAADVLPYLWGGSADLAGSNNTTIESAKSFLPDTPGRVLHFGVREHGMGAIMNGVMAHGKTRVFGGTFLCFSDYMRGSIRLAAEMSLPAIYIFTHDSIGLGEDGPTHQPIEHINALRLMPKLDVIRPADLNETFYCWEKILDNNSRPSAFLLSRQKLPNLYTYDIDRRDVRKGAYIISRSGNPITYVLVATGSEVSLAIKVSELLKEQDIFGNIISMPCWEWFMECDDAYKQKLLPEEKIKFSLEAGTTRLWKWLLGKNSYSIGIDNYGSSGSEKEVYDHFGLSPEKITKEIINQIR